MPMVMGVPALSIGLALLGLGCAVLFGLREQRLQPLPGRAVIKAGAVGSIAAALVAAGGGGFLVAALLFSALGDFLLALERKLTFALGMAAFLAAHICYIMLFAGLQQAPLEPLWPRLTVAALLFLGGVLLVLWLWRDLGFDRFTVPVYALALIGMATTVWFAPWAAWPAMIGALLFVFSDAVLAGQTFRADPTDMPPVLRGHSLVWATYAVAQALLVTGALLAS
jgi:uncharacterized membrane protein YhhN